MKIPILLYHQLFDQERNRERYAISKEAFEGQINYLSENRFRSLSVNGLCKPHNTIDKNGKGIAITFDDGNYSDYSIAFPILKKYGFIATFFVTVNWIGTKNYMNWSHLREMVAEGMSVQSHGLTHSFLSDLSIDNLHKELIESKNILEDNLNMPVEFISIPGGFFSKKVLSMAKNGGYKGVCTSVPGMNVLNSSKKEFAVLNRFVMTRKIPFQDFKSIVHCNQKQIAFYKAQHYLKSIIKRILGSKRYYSVWSKFFREV